MYPARVKRELSPTPPTGDSSESDPDVEVRLPCINLDRKCPVCQDRLSRIFPRTIYTLPCGHGCCSDCHTGLMGSSPYQTYFPCPYCRYPAPITTAALQPAPVRPMVPALQPDREQQRDLFRGVNNPFVSRLLDGNYNLSDLDSYITFTLEELARKIIDGIRRLDQTLQLRCPVLSLLRTMAILLGAYLSDSAQLNTTPGLLPSSSTIQPSELPYAPTTSSRGNPLGHRSTIWHFRQHIMLVSIVRLFNDNILPYFSSRSQRNLHFDSLRNYIQLLEDLLHLLPPVHFISASDRDYSPALIQTNRMAVVRLLIDIDHRLRPAH